MKAETQILLDVTITVCQFVKYVLLIQCKTDCMNCGVCNLFIESGML